jgi:hypothetical protein
MDVWWKHPFTAVVAGPSSCGKTVFTFKFISEAQSLITPPPEKIIYCYGVYQEIFNEYPHVSFTEGLPDISQFDGKQNFAYFGLCFQHFHQSFSSSECVGDLSFT